MEMIEITVERRSDKGKERAGRLRRAGVIPASVVTASPSSHLDGGQVAANAGGEILTLGLRVLTDDEGT